MSKRLNDLSMDSASGMSRRKALWRFMAGGAAGILAGRQAKAKRNNDCVELCRQQIDNIKGDVPPYIFGQCVAASAKCPPGVCAKIDFINGSGIHGSGIVVSCGVE